MNEDCLVHYGVLGMKWGVHKATKKASANTKLAKKVAINEKKSAIYSKKSEKAHAKYDLEKSNRKAVKAANYRKKAAKMDLKSAKTDNESKQVKYNKRAGKYRYKAATNELKGNQLSKTTGYGAKAMSLSVKSDEFARKAAKGKMKIANNDYYISKMKNKASAISESDLQTGYEFVNKLYEL